jgi:hypothetical protein
MKDLGSFFSYNQALMLNYLTMFHIVAGLPHAEADNGNRTQLTPQERR